MGGRREKFWQWLGLLTPFAAVAFLGVAAGAVRPLLSHTGLIWGLSLAVVLLTCIQGIRQMKPAGFRRMVLELSALSALTWITGYSLPAVCLIHATVTAIQLTRAHGSKAGAGYVFTLGSSSLVLLWLRGNMLHLGGQSILTAMVMYAAAVIATGAVTTRILAGRDRMQGELVLLSRNREAAAKLAEANVRLQDYAAQCVELALAQERVRLARDIHDTLGHMLSALIRQMDACQMLAPVDPQAAAEVLGTLCETARNGLQEVRQSVGRLRAPEAAASVGRAHWFKLIEAFIETTGVEVRIELEEDFSDLREEVDIVVYRVIQESLTNAYRHGHATLMGVYVWWEDGSLNILVSDNGHGAATLKEGFGMQGIRERVRELGGRVEWRSEPGRGFDVGVEIPLPRSTR